MSRKKENKVFNWLLTFSGIVGIDKPFHYKYISNKDFTKYSKTIDIDEFTDKKVLAPRWSKDDIYPLYYNKNIKFIAFPLTMHGEFSKLCDTEHNCPKIINNPDIYHNYKGTNEGTHDIALLYNKSTKELEVIDHEFGLYSIFYNYETFLNVDLLKYVQPFFQTFGMEIQRVHLPMFRENRFSHLYYLLEENKFPHDFSIIYKSFIANYIYIRTLPDYIDKEGSYFYSNRDVLKRITPKQTDIHKEYKQDYINRYLELCRFMKEFPYDSKWIPLDITQTKVFEFSKPCPKGYMRDFFTGECIKIPNNLEVDLPNRLLETGKPVYPEHPVKWMTFIIRYFNKQYKNTAIMEPSSTYHPHPYEYTIQFNDTASEASSKHTMRTRQVKPRMKMILPKGFDEFMEKSISDTSVRFIMCLVNIKFEGTHSSPVIIDKDSFTIERIEVNAPFIEVMGATREDDLDNQLEQLFKQYFPDFSYIRPLAICPYGLHRAEYIERTENVADIGGRCTEWALYYIHLKLANEDLPTRLLSSYAFEELRKTGSIKHMITGYTTSMIRESRRRKASPIITRKPRSQLSRIKSADYKSKSKKNTLKTV